MKCPVRNAPALASVCTVIEPLPTETAWLVLTTSQDESLDTRQVQVLVGAVTVTSQLDGVAPE
jgi:hypothetical protein